ncbi:MAG: hypothetical protein HUK20_13100 [Fibrobacter sp.]|nr:hypothetical protein [Fibrobacter sp.]
MTKFEPIKTIYEAWLCARDYSLAIDQLIAAVKQDALAERAQCGIERQNNTYDKKEAVRSLRVYKTLTDNEANISLIANLEITYAHSDYCIEVRNIVISSAYCDGRIDGKYVLAAICSRDIRAITSELHRELGIK